MAARFQEWVYKNVWDFSKKSVSGPYNLKGEDAFARIVGYNDDFSEEKVTEKRAHGLATVYTCINVRAQTLSALPINIIRESNGKKEVLTDHPAYEILSQQPNNYMSSANMELTSSIHVDSWGNSVLGINRDGFGRPTSFDLIDPNDWSVYVREGTAWYKINGEVYNGRDVLHYRYWSYDGITGVSPIRQNAITMGKAIKSERYSSMTIGKKPPGLLSYEGELRPEQRAQNKESWKKDIETGETPILSGRWTYTPIILPPNEAQYIETEGLTDQKIYGIYRVPPVFAQNYGRATWKNAEESDLIFAKHTMTPMVRIREQEQNMKLFTEKEKKNTFVKYNMNGLLRGDIQARAAFYTAMRNIGGMNSNEIRSLEDMNSYEGGDIHTVQGALAPVDMLREIYKSKLMPSASEQIQKDLKDKTKLNGHSHLTDIYN